MSSLFKDISIIATDQNGATANLGFFPVDVLPEFSVVWGDNGGFRYSLVATILQTYVSGPSVVATQAAALDGVAYSIGTGSLPEGLQLDRITGSITGTPINRAGNFSFSVVATETTTGATAVVGSHFIIVTGFECEAGTTDNDSNAATPCVSCSAGQYTPANSVGICSDFVCAVGFTDNDGNATTTCVQCTAGQYSPEGSFGACDILQCGAGETDHDASPSTPCTPCFGSGLYVPPG